jgi:hypothetical protein
MPGPYPLLNNVSGKRLPLLGIRRNRAASPVIGARKGLPAEAIRSGRESTACPAEAVGGLTLPGLPAKAGYPGPLSASGARTGRQAFLPVSTLPLSVGRRGHHIPVAARLAPFAWYYPALAKISEIPYSTHRTYGTVVPFHSLFSPCRGGVKAAPYLPYQRLLFYGSGNRCI